MQSLLTRLEAGEILILDGATGTYLQEKGLLIGEAPETWNFSCPDAVRDMAAKYAAAGADVVETNSFGGNWFRLQAFGMADRVREVNRVAAKLAREGVGQDRFVMGSMGPTGETVTEDRTQQDTIYAAFVTQAEALAEGGVDGFCVETMMTVVEAKQAIRAAKTTGLPAMASMTFDSETLVTPLGVTVEQAVVGLVDAGADVVGANCGEGIVGMVGVVQAMGRVGQVPLLAQANAGLPEMDGDKARYLESPEMVAGCVPELVAAGVQVIGGCCGTGPAHIRAIRESLK